MSIELCPAGCGRTQKAGKFLCLKCWSAVARPQQLAVLRAWDAFSIADPVKDSVGYLIALRNYRMARKDALWALASNPVKRSHVRQAAEDLFTKGEA